MYCARVSSPHRQMSEDTRLLEYCIKHGHWSPFEMASICLEINTTRAISAQILRHRSFHFQEFSQRYASVATKPGKTTHRIKAKTNRQSSIEVELDAKQQALADKADALVEILWNTYNDMLFAGISNETARNILPLSTPTRLYMSGTVRDWLHYCKVRTSEDTQKEHRDVANEVSSHLKLICPFVFNAFKNHWMQ